MDEQAALLRAIIEAPTDDVPRLVYADWLEENGQPERAAFIRMQIELHHRRDGVSLQPPPSVGTYENWDIEAIESACETLLTNYGQQWRNEFPQVGPLHGRFERGFVESVLVDRIPDAEIVEWVRRFTRDTPGRTIVIGVESNRIYDQWERWLEAGMFDFATRLVLGRFGYDDERRLLWLGDHLPSNITQLRITGWGLVDPGEFRRLALSSLGARIERLEIDGSMIHDESVLALVSIALPKLVELDLSYNLINDQGLQSIALSPYLPALRCLRMERNLFGSNAMLSLVQSPVWKQLITLDINGCEAVTDVAGRQLAKITDWNQLRCLELKNTSISASLQTKIQSQLHTYHHPKSPARIEHRPGPEKRTIRQRLKKWRTDPMNPSVSFTIIAIITLSILTSVYRPKLQTKTEPNLIEFGRWMLIQPFGVFFAIIIIQELARGLFRIQRIECIRRNLRIPLAMLIGVTTSIIVGTNIGIPPAQMIFIALAGIVIEVGLICFGNYIESWSIRSPPSRLRSQLRMTGLSVLGFILVLSSSIDRIEDLWVIVASAIEWGIIRILIGRAVIWWDQPLQLGGYPGETVGSIATGVSAVLSMMLISTYLVMNRTEWAITFGDMMIAMFVTGIGMTIAGAILWYDGPLHTWELQMNWSILVRRRQSLARPLILLAIAIIVGGWLIRWAS